MTMTTTSRVTSEQHERSADAIVKGCVCKKPRRSAKKTNPYRHTSTFSDNFGKEQRTELSSGVKGQSRTKSYALHYAMHIISSLSLSEL